MHVPFPIVFRNSRGSLPAVYFRITLGSGGGVSELKKKKYRFGNLAEAERISDERKGHSFDNLNAREAGVVSSSSSQLLDPANTALHVAVAE